MKIRIAGHTIDTEDIRAITDIYTNKLGNITFSFYITLYDKEERVIVSHTPKNALAIWSGSINSHHLTRTVGYNNFEEAYEALKNDSYYKEEYARIKTLHDSLMAYWSNNQSKIPNLEII